MFPFKQAIAPETAHENEQLLELSGWLSTEPEGPLTGQKRCPQGLRSRKAAKPARGLYGPCGLDRRDGSLSCYNFHSKEIVEFPPLTCVC